MESIEYKNIRVVVDQHNVNLVVVQKLSDDSELYWIVLTMTPKEALSFANKIKEGVAEFIFD